MAGLLAWLTANAAAVNSVASLLLLAVTGWYAYLTLRLVRENQELRKSSNRPDIGVTIGLHEAHVNIINLLIENIGNGPAYGLRLSLDRSFTIHGGLDLSAAGPFKAGIALLARGQRMEVFLENAIGNFDRLKGETLKIEAKWSGAAGESYSRTFDLRFDEYENVVRIGTPPLYKIASALESLQEDVRKIGSGWSRLKVTTETAEEAELRRGVEITWARLRSLPAERQEYLAKLIKEESDSHRAGGVGGSPGSPAPTPP